jgi:hypothetical protein
MASSLFFTSGLISHHLFLFSSGGVNVREKFLFFLRLPLNCMAQSQTFSIRNIVKSGSIAKNNFLQLLYLHACGWR